MALPVALPVVLGVALPVALLVALLVTLASFGGADAASPLPFERGSWATLRAEHAGQPTVVHLWGLTCGPCLVELPKWSKLLAERPDLRLVLVAADPVPQDAERVADTLSGAGLANTESWSFSDRFYERLRYEIDPAWAGELPRTVLIDRDGKAIVLPGVADLDRVRVWLDAQSKPPIAQEKPR
jgi:thiol-disulfide isomerase/thioredoxin